MTDQREMTEAETLAALLKAGARLDWKPIVCLPAKLADGIGGRCMAALAASLGHAVKAEDGSKHHVGAVYWPSAEVDGAALEDAMREIDKAALI